MTFSPISNTYGNYYGTGAASAGYEAAGTSPGRTITGEKAVIAGSEQPGGNARIPGNQQVSDSERDERKKKMGIEDPAEECRTCKNRKYKDGSDEMVSFKTPQHVSPESAASAVRAHEQEHVSNAYKEAATENGKVVSASVSIHTAVCPECGRTYVSGGTTHTQIKYYNEDNPYQQDLKSADRAKYAGMNLDYAV